MEMGNTVKTGGGATAHLADFPRDEDDELINFHKTQNSNSLSWNTHRETPCRKYQNFIPQPCNEALSHSLMVLTETQNLKSSRQKWKLGFNA